MMDRLPQAMPALHDALEHMQGALSGADPLQAYGLMPLIQRTVQLRADLGAFIDACIEAESEAPDSDDDPPKDLLGLGLTVDQRSFILRAISRAKREILDDMDSGRVPRDVQTFADLHDHVDANEYGGLCGDMWIERANLLFPERTDPDTISTQGAMDAANLIQGALHQWLQAGRPDANPIGGAI